MYKDHIESNRQPMTERLERYGAVVQLVEFDDYYLSLSRIDYGERVGQGEFLEHIDKHL